MTKLVTENPNATEKIRVPRLYYKYYGIREVKYSECGHVVVRDFIDDRKHGLCNNLELQKDY